MLGIDAGRLGRTSSGVGCSAGVCQACGPSGVPKFGSHGVFGRRSQDGEHSSHLCGPVVSGGSHLRCWQIRSQVLLSYLTTWHEQDRNHTLDIPLNNLRGHYSTQRPQVRSFIIISVGRPRS